MSETSVSRARILVVMPESTSAKDLVAALEGDGADVLWVREGQSAYDILDTEVVNALIYPLKQVRIDGLRLQKIARDRNASICAIAIATPEEIELGIEAMREGAYDFQLMPLNFAKIKAVLERGLSYQQLVGEVSNLQRRLDERYRFGGIARRSSAWQRIYRQVEQVAQSKTSVLIRGETGTGKGEVAKAIHQQSRRRGEAFVEVNCGALPEGVVESELFGHERGAFTGAATARKGRFELADEGTLFLDEVGDIPPPTQVKLLRVIQDGRFERVGATQTRGVDVRLIAATHRDLDTMVDSGTYRADLFYRLNVVPITVPPLRERREDIPVLMRHFIRQLSQAPVEVSERVDEACLSYAWPGNVRELRNLVERMLLLREGARLTARDLPAELRAASPELEEPLEGDAPAQVRVGGLRFELPPHELDLKALERAVILATLAHHDGNQSASARYLKIPRHALLYRLGKLSQGERD